jgi:cytochrome c oxidase assembly protein subunit 15
MAGVVLGMVTLGGYVRLKKAGLSMVKWDLTRLSLPRDDSEWQKEFEEYKSHCPQYDNDFPQMNLEQFKYIYKLEYYHRHLGKTLGGVFAVPFLFFLAKGWIRKKAILSSLFIFSLGGLQGAVGWWMVRSGLKHELGHDYKHKDVKVSAYRLAFHFTLSVIIYSLLLKTGLLLVSRAQVLNGLTSLGSNKVVRRDLMMSVHFAFVTLVWGAFMAGNDAGKITNTFPKMGDIWIPRKEHFYLTPIYRNFFENKFIVHFTHRWLGISTLSLLLCKYNILHRSAL